MLERCQGKQECEVHCADGYLPTGPYICLGGHWETPQCLPAPADGKASSACKGDPPPPTCMAGEVRLVSLERPAVAADNRVTYAAESVRE